MDRFRYPIIRAVIFHIFLFSVATASWGLNDWTLELDRRDIRVYSKPVEGSPLNSVRGVVRIKASLGRLVTFIRDPRLRSSWDELCGESYLYRAIGPTEELVYLHCDLPWPVSDRDMLNRVTWSQDSNTYAVTMRSRATIGLLPEKEGRVRVVVAANDWKLVPKEGGVVEVTATASIDPVGPLPAWLLNMLLVESPYNSLLRIRSLAEKSDIAAQTHAFLIEPPRGNRP